MTINTIKMSAFQLADLDNPTNTLAGISDPSGGVNIKTPLTQTWTTAGRPISPYDGLMGYNTTLEVWEYFQNSTDAWVQFAQAPPIVAATFILQTPASYLPNAQALSVLSTGILKSTTATGVISISAPLTSIDSLTTAADEMLYTTGSNTYAVTPFTAFARTLVADSTAAQMRTTLGLGTAAVKNATDNTQPDVASVKGAFVTGHVLLAADSLGTVMDGGSPAGMGTVLSVGTGTGLTGGPITTTGTISFAAIAAMSLWANVTSGTAVPTVIGLTGTGSVAVLQTSPLLITPQIGQINDTNGNGAILLTPTAGAANYLNVINSSAGNPIELMPVGTDANIQLNLFSKGTGSVVQGSLATTSQQIFYSGATYQHESIFDYPSTAVTRTYTWPDATGTIALTSGTLTTINADSGSAAVTTNAFTISGGSTGLTTTGSGSTIDIVGLLAATYGGTGVDAPTAHGIMVAQGASPMTPIVLGAGQILIGTTSGDPVAAAINSGTGILVGNATGSITVSLAAIASHDILSNITSGSAAPIANTLTATIDAAIGNTQGNILYRNATGWVVLAPGTAGEALISGGAATNISWGPIAGSGTVTSLTSGTGITLSPSTITTTGSISISIVPLANGGTNANLTASAGSVPYSSASALALSAVGASGQLFQSTGTTAPGWTTATYPATAGAAGNILVSDGANFVSSTRASALKAPTQQIFTSSTGTYTTPTTPSPLYLRVRIVAGGGGGGGGTGTGGSPTSGGAGGTSTFGTSLLTAIGGSGCLSTANSGPAGGGSPTITAPAYGSGFIGGTGSGNPFFAGLPISADYSAGGDGGASMFGSNGASGGAAVGATGVNYGGGGGGGASAATVSSTNSGGGGGGAGAGIDAIIPSPSATYSYAVGAAGTAGAAGTGAFAGGTGGSGYIEVTEYYQ